jgi:hypothetical protein
MKRAFLNAIVFLGIAVLCSPAFGANPARPGTLNYVEGTAFLNGQQVTDKQVGTADLNEGEELNTTKGKVEILLTPGVYLRVGDNSTVKMISPDLMRTQVELERGQAGVEVDQIYPQNNLDIVDGGVQTRLMKDGFYEFDANQPDLKVFSGKASVEVGDGKYKTIKGNHEFALAAENGKQLAKEKPASFNTSSAKDELYQWSNLRSEYLAQANNQIAGTYAYASGFVPGWYWNPYGWDYTFIGVDPFFSPFGWGFYGPWWGGVYGPGFYGGRVHVGHPGPWREGLDASAGFHGEGFHGSSFPSGGFRGGGGFAGGHGAGGMR